MSDDLTAADVSAALHRIWWLPVLRGVVLLILGLLMLVQPLWSVTALVWIFGIFAILDGARRDRAVVRQPQGARVGLVPAVGPDRHRVRRDRGGVDAGDRARSSST